MVWLCDKIYRKWSTWTISASETEILSVISALRDSSLLTPWGFGYKPWHTDKDSLIFPHRQRGKQSWKSPVLAQTALSHTRRLIGLSGQPASEEILINEVAICPSSPPHSKELSQWQLQLPAPKDAQRWETSKGLTARRLYWLLFPCPQLILNCFGTGSAPW